MKTVVTIVFSFALSAGVTLGVISLLRSDDATRLERMEKELSALHKKLEESPGTVEHRIVEVYRPDSSRGIETEPASEEEEDEQENLPQEESPSDEDRRVHAENRYLKAQRTGAWAHAAEQDLRSELNQSPLAESDYELDCRDGICEMRVSRTAEQASDFIEESLDLEWSGPVEGYALGGDDEQEFVVYFIRSREDLPRLEW
ncbi:MAG: hypothetical protein MK135_16085 [Polyangiaceae bacterium]|nr:hypothetical protein [Polyangiaceae bacterium]